ncbi:hypothetical protein BD410DRAFT_377946 [Rickenella mellea]|uniref:F-box domain-containing protein n=1 Tax=Rickenella mellea TaxID=50990 RepID=A0A4Y7PZJ7_9AGAM|nr:hypothetical protein BD410DRAFT_377946 [Rickenella mellea]
MVVSLESLPFEIVTYILRHLRACEILRFCATSRLFHDVFLSSPVLQYTVELDLTGSEDGAKSSLSIFDRLSRLKALEKNWNELNMDKMVKIPIPFHENSLRATSAGYYFMGESKRTEDTGYWGQGQSVRYLELPHCAQDQVEKDKYAWQKISFQGDVLDIRVALQEHDLFTAVTVEDGPTSDEVYLFHLQFKKISTGEDHPFAHIPKLYIRSHPRNRYPKISLDVTGSYVGVILDCEPYTSIHLFNWKSGSRISLPPRTPHWRLWTSLNFLNPDVFAVCNVHDERLEIMKIYSEEPHPAAHCIATFALPQLGPYMSLRCMNCSTSPNITYGPAGSEAGNEFGQGSNGECYPLFQQTILNVILGIGRNDLPGRSRYVSFVIRRDELLRLAGIVKEDGERRFIHPDPEVPLRWEKLRPIITKSGRYRPTICGH